MRIIIIRHGALGDIISASGTIKAIKDFHHNDQITFVTAASFAPLLNKMGLLNIIIDNRHKVYHPRFWHTLYKIIKTIKNSDRCLVYDLQNSNRTRLYKKILKFFGILHNATWHDTTHENILSRKVITPLHHLRSFKGQLTDAGIDSTYYKPTLDFLDNNNDKFHLAGKRFCLLVPSTSANNVRNTKKRWDGEKTSELINYYYSKNILPVIIGSKTDVPFIESILSRCPKENYLSLVGQTDLEDIYFLAKQALFAITMDTGPAHIIAYTGCKIYIIFNNEVSKPAYTAPISNKVHIISRSDLNSLTSKEVIDLVGI